MEIQKSSGVVLSSHSTGEADRIIRVYTKNYGKRKFVLKGIRKSKKRSFAVSEAGTIVNLLYYFRENKEIYIVNEFEIQKHYYEIRNDLNKILHLYLILETVEKTTGFNDPNKTIYDLLVAGIKALASTHYVENLSLFFMVHLLKLHGILPDFNKCKFCSQKDFDKFILNYSDLLPVCKDCSDKNMNKVGDYFDKKAREFLQLILKNKFSSIAHQLFKRDDLAKLLFYICIFIEGYFHVAIKSKHIIFSDISV